MVRRAGGIRGQLSGSGRRPYLHAQSPGNGRAPDHVSPDAASKRYIKEAARLRKEFGVSTGLQRGPIFEVQTDRFALIAVDTGVLKTVDSAQWEWLKAALARSRGNSPW